MSFTAYNYLITDLETIMISQFYQMFIF